jgi:hypothetical protein
VPAGKEPLSLKENILLYDLTSTYFEGQCLANPKAQRGYSRDSRPDCKQVLIGATGGTRSRRRAPPRLEWIRPERFHAACALFRKYADKEWSFTDCVSFGTMRELRVRDAFTTDHHFKQSGLRSALEMNRCERLWNFA